MQTDISTLGTRILEQIDSAPYPTETVMYVLLDLTASLGFASGIPLQVLQQALADNYKLYKDELQ